MATALVELSKMDRFPACRGMTQGSPHHQQVATPVGRTVSEIKEARFPATYSGTAWSGICSIVPLFAVCS